MFLWAAPPEPGVGDRGLVFSSKSLTLRLHEEKSALPWGRASDSMGPPSPLHSLLSELEKSLSNGSQESPVCSDFSPAGLVQGFRFVFERKERRRERHIQTGREWKGEKETSEKHGGRQTQTDVGLGGRRFECLRQLLLFRPLLFPVK